MSLSAVYPGTTLAIKRVKSVGLGQITNAAEVAVQAAVWFKGVPLGHDRLVELIQCH
jgi:hypothetical protein